MAEATQTDIPQIVDQDSNPVPSEFSPDFDDVSDSAIASKHHERLHKLRTWWSKKRPSACLNFPGLMSDSSDSDDDDDFGDDVDDVIFALARCRAMRVVGKLTNIQENVEMIYRSRYGHPDLHDATGVINLSDRPGTSSLDDVRWGQVMLLNSVDILQSKISMVRKLFLAYKMNMSKNKSNQQPEQDQSNHEDNLVSPQSLRKGDEGVIGSASSRHSIHDISSEYHHNIIDKLCSLLLYLIKPRLFSKRDAKIDRRIMLEDAFRRVRVLGLQDCLNDHRWNVLDSCHLPNSSIVLKSIYPSTFFTFISPDDPRRDRTATPHRDVVQTPSSMISQYQDIIVYFRNTALFCAYIYRRLRNLEQELSVTMKHFSEMRDKRFKNCKPVSDGDELLRRVMMKSEAVLEMNEIANTSASPEECRAKRFMIKGILRIEKRTENLTYRFTNWRRSREFPSLRRTNNYHGYMRSMHPQPRESRVFYQMTLGGIIIKRFCIARDSLVRKAFSQSTIGLNDALLIASNFH